MGRKYDDFRAEVIDALNTTHDNVNDRDSDEEVCEVIARLVREHEYLEIEAAQWESTYELSEHHRREMREVVRTTFNEALRAHGEAFKKLKDL